MNGLGKRIEVRSRSAFEDKKARTSSCALRNARNALESGGETRGTILGGAFMRRLTGGSRLRMNQAPRMPALMGPSRSVPWPRAREAGSFMAARYTRAADPVVRKVLNRVAASRVEYLESCYRGAGLTPAQARAKSLFAYAAYRGLLQLAHEAPGVLPDDWPAYADLVRAALVPAAPSQSKPEPKSRKRPTA